MQPTDWAYQAYQALQSLVERYGCIVGYPDSTYRGQRALTRHEFAAGLNACLDRINELIVSSTAGLATQEDLVTLQRLQEEFAVELACNGGAGRNVFTLTKGTGHLIVQDYQDGVDKVSLPNGVRLNQLDLERRGIDIYVFFRRDLLAIGQNL